MRVGHGADQSQQRHPTGGQRDRCAQTRAWPSTRGHRDRGQLPPSQHGLPGVTHGHAGDLFGEDLPAAFDGPAKHAPHGQMDQCATPADRRVVHTSLVAAVHPSGGPATAGTTHLRVGGSGLDVYPVPIRGHRFDMYAGQVPEQVRDLHNGHNAWCMSTSKCVDVPRRRVNAPMLLRLRSEPESGSTSCTSPRNRTNTARYAPVATAAPTDPARTPHAHPRP